MIRSLQRSEGSMLPLTTVAVFVTLTSFAIAQDNPPGKGAAPAPEFDVTSIKPVARDSQIKRSQSLPGGRVDLHNVTVEEIIVNAWHVFPSQILDAPAWIRTAAYDVSAKPGAATKPDEVNLMMRALLRNRFELAIHHETRQLPTYALVIARKDGMVGPSLVKSKQGGCVERIPGNPPPPRPDPAKPATRWCGLLMMRPRKLSGAAVPIVVLAEQVSLRLGRTVIDMTGLKGNYDIDLEWTSDEAAVPFLEGSSDPVPPPDPQGQTILTALNEQLGLKIESRRAPVDVIVIDHIQRPSAN
jgi:bla regulator protein blaR1